MTAQPLGRIVQERSAPASISTGPLGGHDNETVRCATPAREQLDELTYQPCGLAHFSRHALGRRSHFNIPNTAVLCKSMDNAYLTWRR
jgi:hypothetical protein